LRERDSIAAQVLHSRGITLEDFRARLLKIMPAGAHDVPAALQVPFSPHAKKVLELWLREALARGANSVAPEHLLLGIACENESVAMRILREEGGLPAEVIRGAVVESIPAPHPGLIPSDRGAPVPGIVRMERSMGVQVGPSPPVLQLLMTAGALALDEGRTAIEIDDVWVALMLEPAAERLAAELGIDEQAVRAAIARRRGASEPPEASASG
jgi:hypothetical protein